MSSSVDSLDEFSLMVFFSGVGVGVYASNTNDCIFNSASFYSTFSNWISLASGGTSVIILDCQVNSPNNCSTVG